MSASLAFQTPTFGGNGSSAAASPVRYWPAGWLADFMLRMAAHGCAVNESMMLGSRDYAMEKLAHARSFGEPALEALSAQMVAYFSDEPCHACTLLTPAPSMISTASSPAALPLQ